MTHSAKSWLVPAGAFGVALVGVLAIVSGEILSDGEVLAPIPGVASSASAPTFAAAPAGERAVARTPSATAVEAAPPQRPVAVVLEPSPAAATLAVERRTSESHDPAHVAQRLSTLRTLQDRLHEIDALKERLAAEDAIATLRGLLDADLGSEHYEAETLRLYIIARLGELPGPRADAALIARTGPQIPRPQRLVAIETLAGRPAAGRNELTIIARDDHDTVVQGRARWALAQAR